MLETYLPQFSIWTLCLSAITIIGWFSGFTLLLRGPRYSVGNRWLAILLLSFSLILTSYILMWTEYAKDFPYINNWWHVLIYWIGPSLYFYLKTVFKEEIRRQEILLHFLPSVIVAFLMLKYLLYPFGILLGWPTDMVTVGSSAYLQITHLVLYGIWCRHLANNDWQVDINIKSWIKVVIYGFWAFIAAYISYFALSETTFFSPAWDYAISLVMCLGILSISWMGFIQNKVFESQPIEQFIPIVKYQNSTLTQQASLSIRKRLENLIEEDEIYKENELRLDDLAAYIGVSRHHLSQVINEHYQTNFFEFINRYRVRRVKVMLADPAFDHYTILQTAFASGFNNKASFNKFFKNDTGMTPSAYRLMMKEKNKEGSIRKEIDTRSNRVRKL